LAARARLLIVEDDLAIKQWLFLYFLDAGLVPAGVGSCAEAVERVAVAAFDLTLLAKRLPDGTGVALLPGIFAESSWVPLVMMTGCHDLKVVIEAISVGAAGFGHKP
jgi:DNA-binding NtrC family response regulator